VSFVAVQCDVISVTIFIIITVLPKRLHCYENIADTRSTVLEHRDTNSQPTYLDIIYVMWKKVDRLCDLVVRVLGYTTEMYCASCEVQTEFIYVM
jgi:hypothetical protein